MSEPTITSAVISYTVDGTSKTKTLSATQGDGPTPDDKKKMFEQNASEAKQNFRQFGVFRALVAWLPVVIIFEVLSQVSPVLATWESNDLPFWLAWSKVWWIPVFGLSIVLLLVFTAQWYLQKLQRRCQRIFDLCQNQIKHLCVNPDEVEHWTYREIMTVQIKNNREHKGESSEQKKSRLKGLTATTFNIKEWDFASITLFLFFFLIVFSYGTYQSSYIATNPIVIETHTHECPVCGKEPSLAIPPTQ